MSATSAIEWTDVTWNPVTGCSKVSPGCYAETLSLRFGQSAKPWTPENAAENVVLHPERLDQPLRWRQPRMVFVNSMSDLFHELVPEGFIAQVFAVMAMRPDHVFQVLTKRPERMASLVGSVAFRVAVEHAWHGVCRRVNGGLPVFDLVFPLPSVWLGTSIENRQFVGRADVLRQVPAAVRFISAEPLLGPLVGLDAMPPRAAADEVLDRVSGLPPIQGGLDLADIDWLIVGGESGHGYRPMRAEWAVDLRDMAQATDTAFFFKQWGGRTPKAGGRELDGREWNEMPS